MKALKLCDLGGSVTPPFGMEAGGCEKCAPSCSPRMEVMATGPLPMSALNLLTAFTCRSIVRKLNHSQGQRTYDCHEISHVVRDSCIHLSLCRRFNEIEGILVFRKQPICALLRDPWMLLDRFSFRSTIPQTALPSSHASLCVSAGLYPRVVSSDLENLRLVRHPDMAVLL